MPVFSNTPDGLKPSSPQASTSMLSGIALRAERKESVGTTPHWSRRQVSNPRLLTYKDSTLPSELLRHKESLTACRCLTQSLSPFGWQPIPVYGVKAEAHTGEQQQRLLFNPKVSGLLVCSPYWKPFFSRPRRTDLSQNGWRRIPDSNRCNLIGNQRCYHYTNTP